MYLSLDEYREQTRQLVYDELGITLEEAFERFDNCLFEGTILEVELGNIRFLEGKTA